MGTISNLPPVKTLDELTAKLNCLVEQNQQARDEAEKARDAQQQFHLKRVSEKAVAEMRTATLAVETATAELKIARLTLACERQTNTTRTLAVLWVSILTALIISFIITTLLHHAATPPSAPSEGIPIPSSIPDLLLKEQ